jgi:hypothetical protein
LPGPCLDAWTACLDALDRPSDNMDAWVLPGPALDASGRCLDAWTALGCSTAVAAAPRVCARRTCGRSWTAPPARWTHLPGCCPGPPPGPAAWILALPGYGWLWTAWMLPCGRRATLRRARAPACLDLAAARLDAAWMPLPHLPCLDLAAHLRAWDAAWICRWCRTRWVPPRAWTWDGPALPGRCRAPGLRLDAARQIAAALDAARPPPQTLPECRASDCRLDRRLPGCLRPPGPPGSRRTTWTHLDTGPQPPPGPHRTWTWTFSDPRDMPPCLGPCAWITLPRTSGLVPCLGPRLAWTNALPWTAASVPLDCALRRLDLDGPPQTAPRICQRRLDPCRACAAAAALAAACVRPGPPRTCPGPPRTWTAWTCRLGPGLPGRAAWTAWTWTLPEPCLDLHSDRRTESPD